MKPFTTIPPWCLRSAVTLARGQTRLAGRAPPRSRCSRGFIRGLLAAVALSGGCDSPTEPGELNARQVLTVLYRELDGPNWDNNDKWLTRAPVSKWYGVEVDVGGNVIGLHLQRNGLAGELPRELGRLRTLKVLRVDAKSGVITTGGTTDDADDHPVLTGSIPPELGNLRFLRYLSLEGNRLVGTIPPELGNIRTLRSLSLKGNGLEGSIPPELGKLYSLHRLDLSRNGLEGSIPPELGNLASLGYLELGRNALTGSIPPELGNLQKLDLLDLHWNALTGSIPPELGNLRNLNELELGQNALAGPVPPELGNLRNLQYLSLVWNELSGPLPMELIGLPLVQFYWTRTDLCAPPDDDFQQWLEWIYTHDGGPDCPSG